MTSTMSMGEVEPGLHEGYVLDEQSTSNGRKKYKVRWVGYSDVNDVWLGPSRIDEEMMKVWNKTWCSPSVPTWW